MESKFLVETRSLTASYPAEREYGLKGDGAFRVMIEGREHVVEIVQAGAHHLDLVLDGCRMSVDVAECKSDGALWVAAQGRVRRVKLEDTRRSARQSAGGAESGMVTPNFPATVVKVFVTPEQRVTKGEPLVVVSAMKMEMTLSSPRDGVVRAINASEGQSVSPGDELVIVEGSRSERGEGDGQ